MSNELKLNTLERIFLVNQLRILEALYPNEADQLSLQREALERGYEMLYAWDAQNIHTGDDIMTPDESHEVWDTMDMFDAINRSISEDIDTKDYPLTRFAGYDGNNEAKFLSFAQFTVERLRRFEYLPMQRWGYWNSHMPVRPAYRRMLNEWYKIPTDNRFSMDGESLRRVLGAAKISESHGK